MLYFKESKFCVLTFFIIFANVWHGTRFFYLYIYIFYKYVYIFYPWKRDFPNTYLEVGSGRKALTIQRHVYLFYVKINNFQFLQELLFATYLLILLCLQLLFILCSFIQVRAVGEPRLGMNGPLALQEW